MNEIGINELHKIAVKYERKPSAVMNAVSRGFIPGADRYAIKEHGKGHRWAYPPGTDKALDALFRLQRDGYSRGVLRFELFWEGVRNSDEWVNDYCVDMLETPVTFILSHIERSLKPDRKKGKSLYTEGDAFERILKKKTVNPQVINNAVNLFLTVLTTFEPSTTITLLVLKSVLTTTLTDMMRASKLNIPIMGFHDVVKFIMNVNGVPESPAGNYLYNELMMCLQIDGYFQTLLKYTKAGTAKDYEKARSMIRENPDVMNKIEFFIEYIKRSINLSGNETPRQIKGLERLRYPDSMVRGIAVGLLVAMNGWERDKIAEFNKI